MTDSLGTDEKRRGVQVIDRVEEEEEEPLINYSRLDGDVEELTRDDVISSLCIRGHSLVRSTYRLNRM
jgi:hypothetical protein